MRRRIAARLRARWWWWWWWWCALRARARARRRQRTEQVEASDNLGQPRVRVVVAAARVPAHLGLVAGVVQSRRHRVARRVAAVAPHAHPQRRLARHHSHLHRRKRAARLPEANGRVGSAERRDGREERALRETSLEAPRGVELLLRLGIEVGIDGPHVCLIGAVARVSIDVRRERVKPPVAVNGLRAQQRESTGTGDRSEGLGAELAGASRASVVHDQQRQRVAALLARRHEEREAARRAAHRQCVRRAGAGRAGHRRGSGAC